MEDFANSRTADNAQNSGLLAEWLENQSPAKSNKLELAFTLVGVGQDKQDGPGKDVADRLDKELKDFADSKIPDASKDMLAFQKMIDKFCSEPDKKKAMEELGESYSRLRVQLGKEIGDTYDEMEAEGARQPGRKELQADLEKKLTKFFDKVHASDDEWKVYELMEWKDGESKADHQARVREGLKGNKPLLDAYNEMETAGDKVDANKSAKEKELEALHRKQLKDYHGMEPVVNKAYIRSEIKY